MPAPQYVIRDYGGGAVPAQLVNEMGPADDSFAISPTTGWVGDTGQPLGTLGPFTVVVDRYTGSVEKILCSSVDLTSGIVQVYVDDTDGWSGRGYDNTTPQAHAPGGSEAGVQASWSANEAIEANAAVYEVLGAGSSGAFGIPVGVLIPWSGPRTTVPTNFKACDGTPISRTAYAALLAAISVQTTGNVAVGNETISGIPSTAVAEMGVGMKIEGNGIPSSTTIVTIASTTSITISNSPTGTHTGTGLAVYPWGNGDGSTTFNLPDCRGKTPVGAHGAGTNTSPLYEVGNTGGEQDHTLVVGEQAPGSYEDNGGAGHNHSHSHGGGTGSENNNHSHTVAGGGGTNWFTFRNTAEGSGGLSTDATDTGGHTGVTFTEFTDYQSIDHQHGIGTDTTDASAGISDNFGGGTHNNMQPFFVGNWIVRSN